MSVPGLQLSTVSDEFHPDFRTAVTLGAAAGIRRFELRFLGAARVPFCPDAALAEVERIVSGEGVTLTTLSPGLFKHSSTDAEFRDELGGRLPQTLEWAQRLGVRKVLIFSFAKAGAPANFLQQAANRLQEAAALAARAGVTLLVEPEPICRADTGRNTAELLRLVDNAAVAMNYDPGNVAWRTGQDPSDEMADVLPFVQHLHVKDIAAGSTLEAPRWTVPGEGLVDYLKVFRALQAAGYAGEVSLEPHTPGMTAAEIAAYADRVRDLWQRAAA